MTTRQEPGTLNFKIGTVARITGIPADTLRMWERRYGVVAPRRGRGSSRLYSREDIIRLTLIKQLVDRGSAISTVANLDRDRLQEQLDLMQGYATARTPEDYTASSCRVMICGDALALKMSHGAQDYAGIEILDACADIAELEARAPALKPDVIVLEYPALMPEAASEVRSLLQRCGARGGIVVYGFAAREVVRSLQGAGILTLRAPVDPLELRQHCRRAMQSRDRAPGTPGAGPENPPDSIPERLFSNEELAGIAHTATRIQCECPHHLTELIQRLSAFETYSVECENRSPADAALHAYLHSTTARARAALERALQQLARIEGIALDGPPDRAVALNDDPN